MKFLITIIASVVAANAVAIPDDEARCHKIGQPCWKAKRAADAFSNALAKFDNVSVDDSIEALLSHSEGGAAFMAKRGIDELAHAVAVSQDDPAEYYNKLEMRKRFSEDTKPVTLREAIAEPKADPWCRDPGKSCWKRDINTNTERGGIPGEDRDWCLQRGQPCWRIKRAAEAVIEAIADDEDATSSEINTVTKRETEPWCRSPDQPCWKATRDLSAIRDAAQSLVATLDLD
ncbi:clock-controlled pheromone ccg-4 [Colletotrichum truncatum]|uniref:Clock-controlled pheromone ccg-4 n=1 Tax=Colletotrichum truncatum TaxID=5467 RepID=A0ACC3Z3H9_COLTU|nr:clock-controlled pheromone ccg-4 [Colletotrichum truncatum]KAF6795496.1 clock-controlled pheromone ccg-4 [Colletotrichum truncatum]